MGMRQIIVNGEAVLVPYNKVKQEAKSTVKKSSKTKISEPVTDQADTDLQENTDQENNIVEE